jgi:hypothetical protein
MSHLCDELNSCYNVENRRRGTNLTEPSHLCDELNSCYNGSILTPLE